MEEGWWVETFTQVTDNPASCVDKPPHEGHVTDLHQDAHYLLCAGECSCGTGLQKGSCDAEFDSQCWDGNGDMQCSFTFSGRDGAGECTVVEQGVDCLYDVTFTWSAE